MAITTTALKNTLANAYASAATHAALFTANPGSTGAVTGEVSGGSYARKPISWSAASNGVITGTVVFDVPAGVTLTYAGVTSGLSGSNLLDSYDITDQPFASAGTYTLALTYTQS